MPISKDELAAVAGRLRPLLNAAAPLAAQLAETKRLIDGGLLDDLVHIDRVGAWIEAADELLKHARSGNDLQRAEPFFLAAGLSQQALRLLAGETGRERVKLCGSAWRTSARAHESTQDLIGAVERWGEAAAAYRNADDLSSAASALNNRGVALQSQGRLEEALAASDEAIAVWRGLVAGGWSELAHDLASALMNRGVALRLLERIGEATADFTEAIAILRSLVRGGRRELGVNLATALESQGALFSDSSRSSEALLSYEEAVFVARAVGNELAIGPHWRALLALAMIWRRANDKSRAAEAIDEAIDVIERFVSRVALLEDRLYHREAAQRVYRLAALLAAERGDSVDAFDVVQKAKGRVLADLFATQFRDVPSERQLERRLAELSMAEHWLTSRSGEAPMLDGGRMFDARDLDVIRQEQRALKARMVKAEPERALLAFGAVRSLADVVSALRPGEALLDCFDVGDCVIINLLVAGQAKEARVRTVDGARLKTALQWWDEALAVPEDETRWTEALTALGGVLLHNLLPMLREGDVDHLIISPSGRLHRVPFAALRIADAHGDPCYLTELFELSLVPTATSLWLSRHQTRQTWPPTLVAAAPFATAEEHDSVGRGRRRELGQNKDDLLPATGREAQTIATLVQERSGKGVPTAALLGAQATRAAVLALAPAAKLVVLATHGRDPDEKTGLFDYHLIFHSSCGSGADQLSVREVLARKLPLINAFQICLTACHLGEVVLRGEEALGFAQAFLSAGAGVVLAPLWAVDDAATCELSIAYHDELLSDERPSAAAAWQQAMATIRMTPGWEHPYFWAGFLPTGDGALRLGG